MDWNDPYRIRSARELMDWINEIGFLPLFRNEVPGFSVEEHTSPNYWFSGSIEEDPWYWRELIAQSGEVAYGKFFGGKAGFVSREWFAVLANYRRDGYDFDTRWEEGIANHRQKKLMDALLEFPQMSAVELKQYAGFGKGGEKNFNGILTELQMQTYLVVADFRKKVSRKGLEYGMPVSVLTMPETLWGYDAVTSAYREAPEASGERIYRRVMASFPQATTENLKKLLR